MNLVTGADDFQFVGISDDTFLSSGDTIFLQCIGYGRPSVELTWSRNNQTITNSPLITSSNETLSGGIPYTQSFLQICSIGLVESGEYTCTVNTDLITTAATTQLTVSCE